MTDLEIMQITINSVVVAIVATGVVVFIVVVVVVVVVAVLCLHLSNVTLLKKYSKIAADFVFFRVTHIIAFTTIKHACIGL